MKDKNTSYRLKEIMNERNLKQVDILEKVQPLCKKYNEKINKSHLSQWVSGTNEPNQRKLFILAEALNVSEVWLMGFDVPMNKTDIDKDAEIDAEITNAPIELKEYMLKLANMNSENQKAVKDFIDFCLSKNN